MMLEIKRAKQILVNNGYSNIEVEKEIKSFLRTVDSPPRENQGEGSTHTLFYRNFMNNKCKEDERVLKRIVKENVSLKNNRDRLKLVIYYKNMKSRNLIMRNNCAKKPREFAKTHVVYKFRCKKGDCEHLPPRETTYPGLTTDTLSRRLSFHLQNGAIRKHCEAKHGSMITRKEIEKFTSIEYVERDVYRLEILEALIINAGDYEINRQDTGKKRILKLYGDKSRSSGVNTNVLLAS